MLLDPEISAAPPAATGTGYWYGALGMSTVVHVAAVLGLACLLLPGDPRPVFTAVDSRWAEPPAPARDELELLQPPAIQVVQPQHMQVGGARSASQHLQAPRSQPPIAAVTIDALACNAPSAGTAHHGENLVESPGAGAGAVGGAAAWGRGEGSGLGDAVGAGGGFFGQQPPGRSFVYVVDASLSMNHPHESEARTRFRRVQLELLRSIGNMTPDMRFFVIYFQDVPLPMPARSLQPAWPDIQQRMLQWAVQFRAGGNTDPREALQMALRLQPDVIYFLTDGSFDARTVRDLKKLSQRRVAIHTFAMGNPAGAPLLKAIAEANGGTYHFVP